MNGRHVRDDELDRLLAGEEIDREAAAHVAGCLVCRHRYSAFLGAVAAARGAAEPDEGVFEEWRASALARWGEARPTRRRLWLAAAAALFLVVLLPVTLGVRQRGEARNAAAVLEEVDAMLARDPLVAVAPVELVDTVIGDVESAAAGGAS